MDAIKNLSKHSQKMVICQKCDGEGYRVIYTNTDSIFDDTEPMNEKCKFCLGTGRLMEKTVIEYEHIKTTETS